MVTKDMDMICIRTEQEHLKCRGDPYASCVTTLCMLTVSVRYCKEFGSLASGMRQCLDIGFR